MTTNRAIGLVRVSTGEQSKSGLGIESQWAAIEQACKDAGLDLTDRYADAGVSGTAPLDERLGLVAALDSLRKGDTLVVAMRDRLTRDDFLRAWIEREVSKKGARILSAAGEGTENDTPSSILLRRITDAIGEFNVAIIRARIKAAAQAAKARGTVWGKAPYGMRVGADGKTLEPDSTEQAIIARVVALHAVGASIPSIMATLTAEGHQTRTGAPWRETSLRRILARK